MAFFAFMAFFAGVFYAGSQSVVNEEDASEFVALFEGMVSGIDGAGIFTHNTPLALVMFVPGLGMALGMFSAWSTGYAFAAIATAAPELSQLHPLALIFLTPFGLMEITAYSLATSRSFMLTMAIIRKDSLAALLKPTLIEAGIAVGLLLAGGYVEFYMIEMAKESGDFGLPGL